MAGPSGSTAASAPQDARALTRRILALAVPAFGALIAEPLFLLADTAIIGHLGTAQLAGVGIGTTILHTLTGLMIFLAYATTPAVARLIGAGNPAAAMDRGRDGIWLGLLLGAVLAVLGWLAAPALTAALGATGEVQAHAVAYLRWSMPGLPALLAVLAATGVLRGLQDTVTPLVVAGVGFGANIGLNVALVYGLGWGVAGSAVGTSVVQWAMLVTYLFVLAPRFRRSGTAWAPRASGMRATAQVGSWLLLRTASLRAAILITVMAAAGAGDLTLAAQALIGAELGAARPDAARRLTRTMVRWGLGFGVVTGAVLALAAPVLPGLFTTDPTVQAAATVGLWVLAVGQPVAGYVFVLDGVLIGAGDARYLALAGLVNLVVYAPALWVLAQLATGGFGWTAAWPGPHAAVPDAGVQLGLLWLGFAGVYMGMRALTLGWRARRDDWMRLGVV
ncbi:MATE family efflux transporter [Micrococcus luteus]|uniref:MATE family efflux transporter n=1 Tax=Micrococcus luteus TaxID=1270 RepID=UPI0010097211|nr:MATE family efflux transporter [Micrococcus luteus]QAV28706.1 MATE family efflux transporter [Micrococcus luteus]